ncbi:hypothetical protein POVCU2_0041250 [Plasmodium ovale curtisi]|uniref:Uncharacterized protein n=1 Tax=Plasmodium ovale curtisi TaxID=864141 RepID=A0A1A8W669_PLAOA|nr:hypothetical protein POVCU2_0041250 [Plasmodium ovale curtisi]SBS97427.1 hypothetical protein POVCU1_038130 [Plasmodium ovale curtisi]
MERNHQTRGAQHITPAKPGSHHITTAKLGQHITPAHRAIIFFDPGEGRGREERGGGEAEHHVCSHRTDELSSLP